MGGALEAMAFLTRSETRVTILRELDGGPCDRRELETASDASRSTVSRALAELQERGWIRFDGRTYTITTVGSEIITRFVPLLEAVKALETLGEGLDYLPVEEMELDIRHLHDADLVTPTEFHPMAAFEHGIERLRESETVRGVARVVSVSYIRAIREQVLAADLAAEITLDSGYVDAVVDRDQQDTPIASSEDSGATRLWRDIVTNATVRRYEGQIPYQLFVLDGRVHLWLYSADGESAGLLESDNPAVREWAESTVTTYFEQAQPVRPEMVA